MISDRALQKLCDTRRFQRARQIAASDENIIMKRCRFSASDTILQGFVASSHGWNDRYKTAVAIDEEQDVLLDYSCTCPDFLQNGMLCKHCLALALSYNAAPFTFSGYNMQRIPDTTSCISELMRQAERMDDIDQETAIELSPIFTYGYHTWTIRFKITGNHGSYIVKSISEFIEHIHRGDTFTYGKNLTVTHALQNFTERSRALIGILERAVASREQFNRAARTSRVEMRPQRELTLTQFELIDFLDALDGTHFVVEGHDLSVRQKTTATILNENPEICISMQESDKNGYIINRNTDAIFISHGERMYIWIDDYFYRCTPDFTNMVPFLRSVYDSESEDLFINNKDMPLFCATILPAIEKKLAVSTPSDIDVYRPVPCTLEFYFDYAKRTITLDARAVYGPHSFSLFSHEHNADGPAPLRNERTENKGRLLVEEYFASGAIKPTHAELTLEQESGVAALLFGGLTRFQKLGETYTTPAFDRLITQEAPRVQIGISLCGNLINLDVSAQDIPPEEIAAILTSYREKKHYHRLKSGAFMNIEDLDLAELDRIAHDLQISASELAEGTIELPSYRAFYLDEELTDAYRDDSFTAYIDNFRTIDASTYQVPLDFKDVLRPYQVEGFQWMNTLCDMGFGGVLADEMGLGKSVQTISFLSSRLEEIRDSKPCIIVCPASLVFNWASEFKRFAPHIKAVTCVGSKAERMRIRGARNYDVLITSYDLLRIDIEHYEADMYWAVVLDEAQYIKNHGTLTARSVKRLQARHKLALSGTPMENRLSEIWSMFDFLMPGFLGSYMRFKETFELDIVGGDEDAAHRLKSLIGPFMLRRLKTDVLPDLPEKLDAPVFVQLTDKQKELYYAHEQHLRESLTIQKNDTKNADSERPDVEVLAELMRLRQICCDPRLLYENYTEQGAKLEAMMDLIKTALDGGEKTLVFSQFTSFLSLIAQELNTCGITYYTITGTTPKKQRVEMVDAFNQDDTPVFLVSLKAGGTGLNLTGASVVIHADPWWNAAAQNQATDRAHRIGQERVVSVHRIIAKDTIEERIMRLQEMKSDLADQVIGGEGISLSSLSRDDLIDLLEG